MKLYFKQRIFSWFDSYDIYNAEGIPVFEVKGKLSWGHLLKIYDTEGNELGTVSQVILTFMPKFEFYIGDQFAGTMSKELTLFTNKYNIDFNGWSVTGDIMGWNYEVEDAEGNTVATVTKELFHMSDHYIIDITRVEDALEVLMLVLAIDAEKCTRSRSNSQQPITVTGV